MKYDLSGYGIQALLNDIQRRKNYFKIIDDNFHIIGKFLMNNADDNHEVWDAYGAIRKILEATNPPSIYTEEGEKE